MPLTRAFFTGSARIKEGYEDLGRRSLKMSCSDEPDAIRRLQKALLAIEGAQRMKELFPGGFEQHGGFLLDPATENIP